MAKASIRLLSSVERHIRNAHLLAPSPIGVATFACRSINAICAPRNFASLTQILRLASASILPNSIVFTGSAAGADSLGSTFCEHLGERTSLEAGR